MCVWSTFSSAKRMRVSLPLNGTETVTDPVGEPVPRTERSGCINGLRHGRVVTSLDGSAVDLW